MFKIFALSILFQTVTSNITEKQYLLSTSVLYGLSFVSRNINTSSECINDLKILGVAVDDKEEWAIKGIILNLCT